MYAAILPELIVWRARVVIHAFDPRSLSIFVWRSIWMYIVNFFRVLTFIWVTKISCSRMIILMLFYLWLKLYLLFYLEAPVVSPVVSILARGFLRWRNWCINTAGIFSPVLSRLCFELARRIEICWSKFKEIEGYSFYL